MEFLPLPPSWPLTLPLLLLLSPLAAEGPFWGGNAVWGALGATVISLLVGSILAYLVATVGGMGAVRSPGRSWCGQVWWQSMVFWYLALEMPSTALVWRGVRSFELAPPLCPNAHLLAAPPLASLPTCSWCPCPHGWLPRLPASSSQSCIWDSLLSTSSEVKCSAPLEVKWSAALPYPGLGWAGLANAQPQPQPQSQPDSTQPAKPAA